MADSESIPDPLWSVSVPVAGAETLPLRNCPVTDGRGYVVAALQDVVVCLQTGDDSLKVVWEYAAGSVVPVSPTAAPDGSLRVHSEDGRLHAISPNGEPLWPPVEIGTPLNWSAPLVDVSGTTWIAGYSGGIVRVEADGSTSRRPFLRSPTKLDCTGVLHGETLIIGGEDHFVHAINTAGKRGREIWDMNVDHGRTGWFVNSAIAVTEGPLFIVAGRDEHLYAFEPDGTLRWKERAPGQMLGSPVVDGQGIVLVGLTLGGKDESLKGQLAAFSVARRRWIWQADANGPVESTPVVGDDGIAYVGDNAGWVHAVDSHGATRWQIETGAAVRSPGVIVNNGQVVFGDDAGRLFALRCESTSTGDGWPAYRGSGRWAPGNEDELSTLDCASPCVTVRVPFDCVANKSAVTGQAKSDSMSAAPRVAPPPDQVTEAESVAAVPEPLAAEKSIATTPPPAPSLEPVPETDPVVPAEPVTPPPQETGTGTQPSRGTLAAVTDLATGTDLLTLKHHPWELSRSNQLEQRVLFLSNSGPGALVLEAHPSGKGVAVSPCSPIRIPPGGRRFVVVNIEPSAGEWSAVELVTATTRFGRRSQLRIRLRPESIPH